MSWGWCERASVIRPPDEDRNEDGKTDGNTDRNTDRNTNTTNAL